MRPISLAIVGADYPNKRGPGRRFELIQCNPGEPIELRPEPNNPADEHAIAVFSSRGVQIGYVTSQRAPWMKRLLAEREARAIFQGHARFGGWARVAFDGEAPMLPERVDQAAAKDDGGFWPDPVYDD